MVVFDSSHLQKLCLTNGFSITNRSQETRGTSLELGDHQM